MPATKPKSPVRRKRSKVDRLVKPKRAPSPRLYRITPDHAHGYQIEVRIARTRRLMRSFLRFYCGNPYEPELMGLVRSYQSRITLRPRAVWNRVIATIFLNRRDLRDKPSEIVSHECTHAGMAWARLRRANLDVMPGEEVLCYAVGRMVAQVNRIGYSEGIW